MALKVIDLGTTALLGKDGDSNRIANTKNNANHAETFTALGADAEGVLPPALPIAKGGTGATTLEQAKQNLGVDAVNLELTTLAQSINLALSGKEPTLAVGTAAQFYRGDKTWQALDKSAVGLGNVNNTTDAMKPISTATQLALNDKANKNDITAIAKGGTGGATPDEAKLNLGLNRFKQEPHVTSMYSPTSNSRIIIDDLGWGIWSGDPNFNTALPLYHGGTGATTAAAARSNLQVGVVAALNAPDFNTITKAGVYFVQGTQNAANTPPNTEWGYLVVESEPSTEGIRVHQTFIPDGTTGMYSKRKLNASWSPWVSYRDMPYDKTAARWSIDALGVGDFGIGANSDLRNLDTSSPSALLSKGLRAGLMSQGQIGGPSAFYSAIVLAPYSDLSASGAAPSILAVANSHIHLLSPYGDGGGWYRTITFLSDENTTTDGNGFVKRASPIVELYADKVNLNDRAKQQPITFEKVGTGDYLIKSSTGFANESWYIEQPKDSNGNVYHAVIYESLSNGDISVKTYAKKMNAVGGVEADLTQPIDIKENRFIAIRLNELPDDPTAPLNPTITDSEGNAAPTKYHELVEGNWTISEENAAKLEQERLAAMQPLKRRQFRLTLAMNGYDLKQVEALIDGIEDSMQRTIALIEWQDATDFERTNPTLLKMAELMQLTTAQVDALWSFGLSL